MNLLKQRYRRRVIVTTTNATFSGVLWQHDRTCLVLRNAELADPKADQPWIPADGEVVILLSDVAYIQVL